MKLKKLMNCRTNMSFVDVGRGQKGMRKTLSHVTNLKNDASASKGSEVAQTGVNAWAVKTRMEKRFIRNRKLYQAQVQGKGDQHR